MSMTHNQAVKSKCFLGKGLCRGMACPKWIHERRRSQFADDCHLVCRFTTAKSGGFAMNTEEMREYCLYRHGVEICYQCGDAYGHCGR